MKTKIYIGPVNTLRCYSVFILIFISLIFQNSGQNSAQASDSAIKPKHSRIGINLAGPADWNTEHPFVDVFKLSRRWISQKKGSPWGQGPQLNRDINGWVTSLESNCWAEALILTGGFAPVGEYVCLYDGDGVIEFGQNSKIISRSPGRIVVYITPTNSGSSVIIKQTNPTNYIRNIRVIMPGFESTYKTQPFTPQFLNRWRSCNTIRFMDWMLTNGSKQRSWDERPTPQYCNYTERGVPLEVMIELCNQLEANPWFCMPHSATDEYVKQFAQLVKRLLKPSLKIYIEYSNEVWNSIFEQHHYAAQKAKELSIPPADKPWETAAKFYAQRSVELFKIWENVFLNDKDRLVRVIAWQAASGEYWTDKMILSYNDTYKNCDALAIAPYFSMNVSSDSKPNAETVANWSVEQVLDFARTNAIPEAENWMRTHKKVANKYGLRLIAYEAGQHLVGIAGAENNEQLTKLLIAANKHQQMGTLYKIYLDAWKNLTGGDLLCIFSSVGNYSKWGSWGLLENAMQEHSPKYDAMIKWITDNPQN